MNAASRNKAGQLLGLVLAALIWIVPVWAVASPADDANAAIDRWSAAYTANDPDAVVASYWPDAILLGTSSPVISTGSDAIRKYFTDLKLKGSGNRNIIQERHTIPVDDNAVVVTGFYEFIRMRDGKPVPAPSRFTMLVTRRGGEWRIAHHHSSPHVMPKQ
ncbi:MAG: SgcJ/EcaC family oxidoreductase [Gemmatimonadota bacterium]